MYRTATAISPPPLCPHHGSTTTTSYPSKTITTITFLTTYSTTWYTRTSSTGIFYSIQKQTLVRSHVHCYFKIYTKIIIHLCIEKYSSTISGQRTPQFVFKNFFFLLNYTLYLYTFIICKLLYII
jgi:hypothetical protein